MFFDLMAEAVLVAVSMFSKGQRGQATCFFDNQKEPDQIDFMLCHRDWLSIMDGTRSPF